MTICSEKSKKICFFVTVSLLTVFGLILVLLMNTITQAIVNKQLNVASEDTFQFQMWKETPIPMYMEFNFFHWVNHKEVIDSKWQIPIKLVEKGPYLFEEKHYREQVRFNNNNTVTFKTKRVWHFADDKSNGTLEDEISTVNVIVATIADIVKPKHKIVKLAVNVLLKEKNEAFVITKNVKEWIFDGYNDTLLDLVHKLHIIGINVPYKRFGWFVERNGSVDYDGEFVMRDGGDDLRNLGRLTRWNGQHETDYFGPGCNIINGTNGELWYPTQDDEVVTIFAPDICSTLNLKRNGTDTLHGVDGIKYVADDQVFDNGTKYPNMKCYNPVQIPSGMRSVAKCQYGAPAFVSFPHFYMADDSYKEGFDGLREYNEKFDTFFSIEPNTGIPLRVQAAMQLNVKLNQIPEIELLKDVKEKYFPCFWFRQLAELDGTLATEAKFVLVLPSVGVYTGYAVLALVCLILLIGLHLKLTKKRRDLLVEEDTN